MRGVAVALGVLLAALQLRLWFGEGRVHELWRAREAALASRAQVLELRERNAALRAEVTDLKSGLDAVEELARSDLGMVEEGETFFQFVREGEGARRPARARADGAADDIVDDAETAPAVAADATGRGAR